MAVVTDFSALLYQRNLNGNVDKSTVSWNLYYDIGNPVFVTYSFATDDTLPTRSELGGALSTYLLTDDEQASVRKAVNHLAKKAGVTFLEVEDPGMVHIFGADLFGNFAGESGLPITTEYQSDDLNLVLDRDSVDPTTDKGREVILHELMHSLGLEHPHEGTDQLTAELDSDDTTLMSYVENGTDYTTIRAMDREALRFLYGKKDAKKDWSYEMKDDYFEVKGADKNDWITGITSENKLLGKDGNDHLTGRMADDTLEGGKGKDSLVGSKGDDLLKGGNGVDVMHGDGEHLELNGDNPSSGGNDTLKGGAATDYGYGGGGDDLIDGGGGADFLYGEYGADTLKGKNGDDYLDGGIWQDELIGGNGNDTLEGGEDFDTLNGGKGNDLLTDESGSDLMIGGGGKDTINGGAGFDTMTGGAGKDTFIFEPDAARSWDTITDFEINRDKIDMPDDLVTAAIRYFDNYTYNGVAGTLVQTDGGSGFTIHFQGLSQAEIEDNWDSFVI